MSMDLSGFTMTSGESLTDVGQLVTGVSVNWAPGTVAELRIEVVDPQGQLQDHGLLELGTTLTWGDATWQVGSVDRTFTGYGLLTTISARSQLAKNLRLTSGTGALKKISPAEWIRRKVKTAGGTAICEAGARKRTIVQKKGVSVLDVITSLASTTGVEWVEIDGTMVVGTPWWAYSGGPSLPMWAVTWKQDPATDAMSLTASVTEDDKANGASCSISLPASRARDIRPWHLVDLSGAGELLDGTWLVGEVTLDLGSTAPVSLSLTRPLKSAPKKGSAKSKASTASAGSSSGSSTANASSGSSNTNTNKAGNKASNPVSKTTPSKSTPSYAGGTVRPYASGSPGGSNGGTALDVGMPVGTRLYACRSGRVLAVRSGVRNHGNSNSPYVWPAAANYVLLGFMHQGRPAKLGYWHLSPTAVVHPGQWVKAGQLIGYSGNTGHSTGPHTHFQASWGHSGGVFGGSIIFPPSRVWS